MPSGKNPISTLARESVIGLQSREGEVLHYSADTGPLFKTRTPSVVTVHGVASRWIDVARNPRQERTWRSRVSRAIKSTDRLITVSQSAADDISEVFSVKRDDIRVIPHGIDSSLFGTPTQLSSTLRATLPREFALYVGNVEPRKNLIELVRAFDSPEVAALSLPLVIAGRPAWNYAEAIGVIESAANVIYLGFVSDADRIALMQNCSLFVFPSLYEGFGLPVLEAMAAGAPVVASRRGSLREVAGPSYEISDLSAEGIANAVVSAIGDGEWLLRSEEIGRAWAGEFKWSASIEAHLSVYDAVAR
jgi:glycosyltransferase involved in cell wall biosynthesis